MAHLLKKVVLYLKVFVLLPVAGVLCANKICINIYFRKPCSDLCHVVFLVLAPIIDGFYLHLGLHDSDCFILNHLNWGDF